MLPPTLRCRHRRSLRAAATALPPSRCAPPPRFALPPPPLTLPLPPRRSIALVGVLGMGALLIVGSYKSETECFQFLRFIYSKL
jgi:hypothetical protein